LTDRVKKIYVVEKEGDGLSGLMVQLKKERLLIYKNATDQIVRLPISVVSNR